MKRFLSAITIAFVLHAGAARADDEAAAKEAFDRGTELYRAKKFRDAAEAFDRARNLAPRGPTAYNAGSAWRSANEPTLAADAFASALELGGLSDAQKKNATDALKTLDASLGVLDLEGPAGARARVNESDRSLPAHVHVVAGPYKVVFTSGTTTEEKSGTVAKGEHVAIAWQPAASATPSPPVVTPPVVTVPVVPAEPEKDPYRGRRILSVSSIVLGSAFLAGGIYVGFDGMNARDRFVDGGQHSNVLHDKAEEQRTWANVLGIGGVALIAAGVYFLVTTPKWDAPAKGAWR